VYCTNPDAEQAHMAKFAELMKKEYAPKTMDFALAQGLLTMRCTKAKKYAEETMGTTLGLKNYLSSGKEDHDAELVTTREAVKNAEEYCAGRFASFSELLSSEMSFLFCLFGLFLSISSPFSYTFAILAVYSTNPEAEQAHMAKFAELMKKEYTPKTMEFALAQGLLTMRCTKAKKYA